MRKIDLKNVVWKDWSYKKRGTIVGIFICAPFLILSIFLNEASISFGLLWSGTILKITGLDYLLSLVSKPGSVTGNFLEFYYLSLLISSIIFILFCCLIGLIVDKRESWKKKLIIIIILVLFFTPLSTYSNYLKYQDKKILAHYGGGWPSDYITEDICDELSVFSLAQKPRCYEDVYRSSNVINKNLCDKLLYSDKTDCYFRLATQTGEFSHCNSLDTQESDIYECYISAAKAKKDAGICKIMKDNCKEACEFWFEQCVAKVNTE